MEINDEIGRGQGMLAIARLEGSTKAITNVQAELSTIFVDSTDPQVHTAFLFLGPQYIKF